MAKVNMTDVWLRSLRPPTGARAEYRDARVTGLVLRVTPRGVMSWSVIYKPRSARTKRRWTIGTYPATQLADARIKARDAIAAAEKGEDIAERERYERHAPTFSELAIDYLERYAVNKKSGHHDRRILEKDVIPPWKRLKAADVHRRDVICLLDAIVERGAPIQANRTLACIRKLFNWAITRDLVTTNPCWNVSAPAKENRRDRVLRASEIEQFWSALDNAHMSPQTRAALRLLLTTAQRPGEVVNLRWDEIDGTDGWWTIPAAKTKNGLSHRVPLSKLALQIINSVPRLSDYVFSSPSQASAMNRSSLARAISRSRDQIAIEHFSPHDLRRTAASHMTGNGTSRIVVAKILNHAEPGVTAIYDRHSYDKDKRRALERWSESLRSIITDQSSVVVQIREAL